MTMIFSYEQCLTWLREQAARLSALDINVEVTGTNSPVRSVVVKATNPRFAGELVVWETGATSMTVVNLNSEKYVLDTHDKVLSDKFAVELKVFFDALNRYD